MDAADQLLDATINFNIGNYTTCLKQLQALKSTPSADSVQKNILTYRTYIAQKKYSVVLDEVKGNNSSSELQSVRLLAEYLSSNDSQQRAKIVKKLDDLMASTLKVNDYISLLIGATIYFQDGQYETALSILKNSDNLECLNLNVQILISIDRLDLAAKEVRKMQDQNEDSLLSQLAIAMLNLAGSAGEQKLKEAYHIYRELADKYTPTPMLLNGQAAAYMAMNRWAEAEPLLQQALDLDSNSAASLINMMCVSQHLGKAPEVSSRYLSQLKDSNKKHPFVVDLANKEEEFDRICKNFRPTVE